MVILFTPKQIELVTCVSCETAKNGSHEHVTHLNVRTVAGTHHRVALPDALRQLHHPMGERYIAHLPSSGERADVVVGVCPICQHAPYVRLRGGGRLEELPRCR